MLCNTCTLVYCHQLRKTIQLVFLRIASEGSEEHLLTGATAPRVIFQLVESVCFVMCKVVLVHRFFM